MITCVKKSNILYFELYAPLQLYGPHQYCLPAPYQELAPLKVTVQAILLCRSCDTSDVHNQLQVYNLHKVNRYPQDLKFYWGKRWRYSHFSHIIKICQKFILGSQGSIGTGQEVPVFACNLKRFGYFWFSCNFFIRLTDELCSPT